MPPLTFPAAASFPPATNEPGADDVVVFEVRLYPMDDDPGASTLSARARTAAVAAKPPESTRSHVPRSSGTEPPLLALASRCTAEAAGDAARAFADASFGVPVGLADFAAASLRTAMYVAIAAALPTTT